MFNNRKKINFLILSIILISSCQSNYEFIDEIPDSTIDGANSNYLMVTNGLDNYYCKIDIANETYIFLKDIPQYLL